MGASCSLPNPFLLQGGGDRDSCELESDEAISREFDFGGQLCVTEKPTSIARSTSLTAQR